MASADEENVTPTDLTQCSICHSLLDNPKALPCLHTFCLKCLRVYTKGRKQGLITCPLCREDTPLPTSGVEGFRTNFLINKLKERREIQQQLNEPQIPCTSCEKAGRYAVSRCLECRDFLCQRCYDSHNDMRAFRGHRMCTLEEMRSGQVVLQTAPEEEYCEKHKGQVLWFYCKTCGRLICRDGTVVDHSRPDHEYVTLESAIAEQKEEIQRLSADCTLLGQQVRNVIERNKTTKQKLDAAVESALMTIDRTAEKILEDFKKKLDACCQKPKADIRKWQTNVTQNISENDNTLQNQQARLHTALEMASQVIELGSQYDIAAIHAELTNSLKQLKQIKPVSIKPSLSNVKFEVNADYAQDIPNIGDLLLGKKRYGFGTWVVEKQFGYEGAGKLQDGRDIAICPNSNIAVTDPYASQVKVYSSDGQFKQSLDSEHGLKPGKKSCPAHIVVNTNGDYFVTDNTQYVKLFTAQGRYKSQFPAISPRNTPSDAQDSRIVGLALDANGHLLVGDFNMNYISKHQQDGKHISSIKVNIRPYSLTAIPNGNIVISAWSMGKLGVQIVTQTGQLLHTLNAPPGVPDWHTTGVCYSEDIIFISNYRSDSNAGIYCFSVTGEYLGCATKELKYPIGLAITDDSCKLIVVNYLGSNVKMFKLK